MMGVYFDKKHSFDDLGLILASKTIEPPTPKINTVSVPLSNGSIDLTEVLTDSVKYEDRKISMSFRFIDDRMLWASKISEIENFLHGKKMKIVFDDDGSYYYIGRLSVNQWSSDKTIGIIEIEGEVDPFKYETGDEWFWNPFSFEIGVISETQVINVSDEATAKITAKIKDTYPSFIASNAMTVTFKDATYNLHEGETTIYDIMLDVGENTLTFNGSGTVKILYAGGSL